MVESVLPLNQGSALILTTARYLTASGRSVQRPLPGTALAGILEKGSRRFFTDNGRPLPETGGVEPDERANSWPLDEWARFLEQSTAFINFAGVYLGRYGAVTDSFEVDDVILEDFRSFLLAGGVRVPESSWEHTLGFLATRIQEEVFNLSFGISRGEEVEVRADPQVRSAVEALGKAERLIEQRTQPIPLQGGATKGR